MKVHLHSSDDPPHEGADLEALCGERLSKVRLAFVFNTAFEEAANLNRIMICSECFSVRPQGEYLSGMVSGQEAATIHDSKEVVYGDSITD